MNLSAAFSALFFISLVGSAMAQGHRQERIGGAGSSWGGPAEAEGSSRQTSGTRGSGAGSSWGGPSEAEGSLSQTSGTRGSGAGSTFELDHLSHRHSYNHSKRFYQTQHWYNWLLVNKSKSIYKNWIFYPAAGSSNGFKVIDMYPFYIHNGVAHRYSTLDSCSYQLVNYIGYRSVETFMGQRCNDGYDSCAIERDRLNSQVGEIRFFCAENFKN